MSYMQNRINKEALTRGDKILDAYNVGAVTLDTMIKLMQPISKILQKEKR